MKQCFICKKNISGSNYMTIFRLGKDGIVIPSGMKEKDVICSECYTKEKDQYKGSTLYVNPMVKELTFHNKALTPDEVKNIFEQMRLRGPPKMEDSVIRFVDHNYDSRLTAIKKELGRLLSPYTITDTDYLGSMLKLIDDYNQTGNFSMRDDEFLKLEFFLRNLTDIEKYDNTIFEQFKQKVTKALPKGDFFGVRLEVITCSTFIRNGLNFAPIPENPSACTPDFVIHRDHDIFVECTSAHMGKERQDNLTIKLGRAVRSKSSKSYTSANTALFIDATNIFYTSMQNDSSSLEGNLRDDLNKILEDSQVGSVVLFRYLFENRPERRITHGYYRFDNKIVDASLVDFLNAHFPMGKYVVDEFLQPPHG